MLFMAPEGTCSNGRCILRFRTGAFVPGVPVLPVCLNYNKRSHNPAWTIMNVGWHFVSWSLTPCLWHVGSQQLC
jgi:lysophosphatidylcholine acyltransferase/lyso-PAF acetyltransferase